MWSLTCPNVVRIKNKDSIPTVFKQFLVSRFRKVLDTSSSSAVIAEAHTPDIKRPRLETPSPITFIKNAWSYTVITPNKI